MRWPVEDTEIVCGYDPFEAVAVDACLPLHRLLERLLPFDIGSILAGSQPYCVAYSVRFRVHEAAIRWVYWDTRCTWAIRLWITALPGAVAALYISAV